MADPPVYAAEAPADFAREAAARVGIVLPAECVPGVEANLRLLETHLRIVRDEQS